MLVADALHRLHQLLGVPTTCFSTGTDEHGLKVQKAAEAKQLKPIDFCDQISKRFKSLCEPFEVSISDFVRTTEKRHREAVHKFWETLVCKGFIYRDNYEGWYCVADETFVTPSQVEDVVIDQKTIKVSTESGHPVEWSQEVNYMFKLSHFEKPLSQWLESDERVIRPKRFLEQVKNWLKDGLHDISVSRPTSRLFWGIPVPGDESQTVYVWLDALVNYLSVTGYPHNESMIWPPNCQVIGKDILKFHAIYWPAFLMAAGLKPPGSLQCHSHWTVDEVKMSKSIGNVIDPFQVMEKFTGEGLRYYLLREGVPQSDGSFSERELKRTVNAELADTLGNLLSRCTGKAINKGQIYPPSPGENVLFVSPQVEQLFSLLKSLPEECLEHYLNADFNKGVDAIMKCLRLANGYIQVRKPWELAKSPKAQDELNATIYVAFETLRVCSILMQPIVPSIARTILNKLNVSPEYRGWNHSTVRMDEPMTSRALGEGRAVIFPRIKD